MEAFHEKTIAKKPWVIISLLAALGLSLGAVNPAWARGGGRGCMNANLTPEQSAQLFDLKQQFRNDTGRPAQADDGQADRPGSNQRASAFGAQCPAGSRYPDGQRRRPLAQVADGGTPLPGPHVPGGSGGLCL